MEVTSTTPNTYQQSRTYSSQAPTLPMFHRHSRINFEGENGSHGCVAYPVNYDEISNLKGRLLTLIDATFTDPAQRKAQKDVVWQTLKAWMDDIEQMAQDNIKFGAEVEHHRDDDAA